MPWHSVVSVLLLPPLPQVAGLPLEQVCEMKRLFVLPGHHGQRVGAALCVQLLEAAAGLGYQVRPGNTRYLRGGSWDRISQYVSRRPGKLRAFGCEWEH